MCEGELRGNPASGVKPYNSTSGSALATTFLAEMSLSKSIPVFRPIASSKKTRSSVTILPLAPRDDDGNFHLGSSLWKADSIYRDNLQLGKIIRPALIELVEKTTETAAFHVLRGNSGVVLYCENSKRRMRYHIDEGEITPLNLGSSGKVLEAFVNSKTSQSIVIQNQGYYISRGERDPEIAGISVPVLGRDSELIGVLSLSGLISRFNDENIESFLEELISTSQKVCSSFGNK